MLGRLPLSRRGRESRFRLFDALLNGADRALQLGHDKPLLVAGNGGRVLLGGGDDGVGPLDRLFQVLVDPVGGLLRRPDTAVGL